MSSRTEMNHVNEGLIRFQNWFCTVYDNKAMVRISESLRNLRKLYFLCDGDRCDYFEFWVSGRDELNFAARRVGDGTITTVLGLSAEIRGLAAGTRSLMEKVNDMNRWRVVRKLLILVMFVQLFILCKM